MKTIITLFAILALCTFAAPAQPFSPTQLKPAHGSTGVGLRSNLQITYDRSITAQPDRYIEILTMSEWDWELHESIPVDSLIIDGAVVTINPTIEFHLSTQYFISLDLGLFSDSAGNYSAPIYYFMGEPWMFTTTDDDLSADFEADEIYGGTPMTVNFTDLSHLHTAPIIEWTWDFGDGAGSSDQNPAHIYQHSGSDMISYTVSLTVRDANDSVSVRIKENYINVCPPNYFHGGNVSGLWTAANSPYFIGGEIIVPLGDTLSIEPGVSVKFRTNSTESFMPEDVDYGFMTVYGTLIAQGTETDSIHFTRIGNQGYWGFIHLANGSNPDHPFEYCRFEFAGKLDLIPSLGGLTFDGVDATISKSTFAENIRGITCISSNALIVDNTFFFNEIDALLYSASAAQILNNQFLGGNWDQPSEIAIASEYSDPVIDSNVIENYSWGIYLTGGEGVIIKNNTITSNGYGIDLMYGEGFGISENFISSNSTGIQFFFATDLRISHNIITSNTSFGMLDAGSWFPSGSSLQMINNTITGNPNMGLHLSGANGVLSIENCIIYDNTQGNLFPPNTTITWSCIQGGFAGVGNISSDPMLNENFIPVWTNYPVTSDPTKMSPCIDAGDPFDWLNNPSDRDPDGSRMDMGARYFHQDVRVYVYNDHDTTSQFHKFYNFGSHYIPYPSEPKLFDIRNKANHFVDCPVFFTGDNPDQFQLVNPADSLKHLQPYQVVSVPVVFQPSAPLLQRADFTAGIVGQFTDSLRVRGTGLTTGSIIGHVRTPTGQGVEGVTITLLPPGATRTTDSGGYYSFLNIGSGTFSLTPYFEDNGMLHQFDPPNWPNVYVGINNTEVRDFEDISFFTVSGNIHYLNTTCPVEGIQMYVGNLPLAITDETGQYTIDDVQIGSHTFRPDTTGGRSFQPPFITQMIMGPVNGLNFEDKFTYNLSGYVSGGCLVPLADSVRLIVSCLSDCGTTDTIYTNAEGFYSIKLAPLEYSIAVETINYYGTEIIFDTKQADLSAGDLILDFVYRSPPFIEIKGFELFTNEHDWIILEQFETYEIEINVYECYGESGEIICRVDSGNIMVYDFLSDIGEVEIVIDDSLTIYSFVAGTPNIAGGGPFGYQKLIQASYENEQGTALADEWVYITGIRPRETAFATTTPEIPLLILRDPPGDKSYSYFSQTSTVSQAVSFLMEDKLETGVFRTVSLGLLFSMSAGFGVSVQTQIEATLNFQTGLDISMTQNSVTENQFTFIASQQYATSDEEYYVGRKADVYMGGAMNILYGITDVLTIEDNEVIVDQDIIIVPNGFATTYIYTQDHIEKTVIPSLYLIQDTVSAQRWESFLALNQSLKDSAAIYQENISFDAGSPYIASETMQQASTHTQHFELTIEASMAMEAGLKVNGIGATGGYRISAAMTRGVSEINTTANATEIGFELRDNDPGDAFTVDIKTCPVYGTPVFETISGQSQCPYEENTVPRHGCTLMPPVNLASGIDPGEPAIFTISLTNTSQTDETVVYSLRALNETNPHGAIIKTAGGHNLSTPINYALPPNVGTPVIIHISRPVGTAYDFTGLKLELSSCGESGLGVSAQAVFDVYFTPPCSPVSIASPGNNWLVNQASNNILPVTIANYDLDNLQLQTISLEYSTDFGNNWIEIYSIPKGSIGSPTLVVNLDVAGLSDGDYLLRAVATCTNFIKNYSTSLAGIISRTSPQLVGIPQPSDGVLSIGDEISFAFDKKLLPSSVTINSCHLLDAENGLQIGSSVRYSESQQKIIFTINPGLAYFIENRYLKSQVFGVTDRFGNPLADTLSWTFLVDQGPLHWSHNNFEFAIAHEESVSFSSTLSNVSSKEVYYALQLPEWLTATPSGGYLSASGGSVLISFQSEDLSSGFYTDTILAVTLGFPGEEIRILIQSGNPQLAASPLSHEVSALAGEVFSDITSNVSWTVAEDASWLSVEPMIGSNNQTLTIAYNTNASWSGRTGIITLSALGLPDVILTINQAGTEFSDHHFVLDHIVQTGELECFEALLSITAQNLIFEDGSTVRMIAGNKITLLPDIHVQYGADFHARISDTDFCSSLQPPVMASANNELLPFADKVFFTGKQQLFRVYPNPGTGQFVLELAESDGLSKVSISIHGIQGNIIHNAEFVSTRLHTFDLSGKPPGIYFLRIIRDGITGIIKVVKL